MKTTSILTHLAAAAIVSVLMLTVYATVQQAHRSGADDPQLQMARDIAAKINGGQSYEKLLPADSEEISKSLGTFVCIYAANTEQVLSTGMLDGKFPKMPDGVLDYAKANKENVLTWQPREGVRVALVVENTNDPNEAFIAVGRSLQEVEKRESNLIAMVAIAWIACLGVILIHFVLHGWFSRRQQPG